MPEDISVAGFDGVTHTWYDGPKLTTCAIPLEEIGAEAARMVYWRIEHRGGSYRWRRNWWRGRARGDEDTNETGRRGRQLAGWKEVSIARAVPSRTGALLAEAGAVRFRKNRLSPVAVQKPG